MIEMRRRYFFGTIISAIAYLFLVGIFYFGPQLTGTVINSTSSCEGTFNGTVERIIDGDTIAIVGCSKHIRLSLVNAPETYQTGYQEAKDFTANLCQIGSTATINQDDLQPYDAYGRIVALVYCQGRNLNSELFYNNLAIMEKDFCSKSEFAHDDWAVNYCFG